MSEAQKAAPIELAKPIIGADSSVMIVDCYHPKDIAAERERWQTRLDAEKRLSEARRVEGAKLIARAEKAEAELGKERKKVAILTEAHIAEVTRHDARIAELEAKRR